MRGGKGILRTIPHDFFMQGRATVMETCLPLPQNEGNVSVLKNTINNLFKELLFKSAVDGQFFHTRIILGQSHYSMKAAHVKILKNP